MGFSLQSLQSPLSPPLFLFVIMRAGTEGAVGLPLYEVSNLRFFYPLSFYNESRERDSKVLSLYIHSFYSSLSLLRGNESRKRILGSLSISSPIFSLFLNIMWWREKGKRLLSLYQVSNLLSLSQYYLVRRKGKEVAFSVLSLQSSFTFSILCGDEKREGGCFLFIKSPIFALFLNIMWWREKRKKLLSLY